jgi:hypothetical protein
LNENQQLGDVDDDSSLSDNDNSNNDDNDCRYISPTILFNSKTFDKIFAHERLSLFVSQ